MYRIFAAAALTLGMFGPAAAQTLPSPSKWQNQRGSELTITSIESGVLKGTLVHKAEGFECRDKPVDVTGRAFSSEFFFVANFEPCNTIIRWRGQVRGSTLRATWLQTYVRPKDGGFARLSGTDRFKAVK